jgi:RNA 3'-terminal phosphate cyclase (ATP)
MSSAVFINALEIADAEAVVRTAVSLSLLTGRPLIVENFLVNSVRPGLQRRHITMLDLAVAVSRGHCEGVELGRTCFKFYPKELKSGKYTFSVGTAGNVFEVIESVVLPLCLAHSSSQVTVFGATHQSDGPSYDYFNRVVLPLYRSGGLDLNLTLHQAGFAPRGVGKVSLATEGSQFIKRYHLAERGKLRAKRVIAMVRSLNFESQETVKLTLREATGCDDGALNISLLPASFDSMDTVVIELESEFVVQAFTGYVTEGKSLSDIAEGVAKEAESYLASQAPVTDSAAHILLPVMCAAGGGTFVATGLNDTARSVIGLCKEFYPVKIKLSQAEAGAVEVAVRER